MLTRALDVVLLGPPGAGKGTQAHRMAAAFELLHVSTGDLLRDEAARGTVLGREAEAFMAKGELVPDELVRRMLFRTLHSQQAAGGCVFDGYPRTAEQAALLDALLAELTRRVDAVVTLEVPDDVLLRRLGGRRSCMACGAVFHLEAARPKADGRCDACGGELVQRDDDAEAVVGERIAIYRSRTRPLVTLFGERGILREVDGTGSPDEVFARVRDGLGSVRP